MPRFPQEIKATNWCLIEGSWWASESLIIRPGISWGIFLALEAQESWSSQKQRWCCTNRGGPVTKRDIASDQGGGLGFLGIEELPPGLDDSFPSNIPFLGGDVFF